MSRRAAGNHLPLNGIQRRASADIHHPIKYQTVGKVRDRKKKNVGTEANSSNKVNSIKKPSDPSRMSMELKTNLRILPDQVDLITPARYSNHHYNHRLNNLVILQTCVSL